MAKTILRADTKGEIPPLGSLNIYLEHNTQNRITDISGTDKDNSSTEKLILFSLIATGFSLLVLSLIIIRKKCRNRKKKFC